MSSAWDAAREALAIASEVTPGVLSVRDAERICPEQAHRSFWRSTSGQIECAVCHRPVSERVVVEWLECGERPTSFIVARSIRRSLQTVGLIEWLKLKRDEELKSSRRKSRAKGAKR